MEEYAYILDYLAPGLNPSKRDGLCYAMGEEEFKLFELVPKAGVTISIDERVYIGKDPKLRNHIDHVKRRVGYEDLTATAVSEIEYVVKDIVLANPDKYIKFYNDAGPISIKKHLLEELPGLGKKTVTEILTARKAGPFKDFEDLKARAPVLKDPAKPIVDRIVLEISDRDRRHSLFIQR